MARIRKNGLFSGVIGNVVFVQSGDVQYARSKPTIVKQNAKTKAAASVFGWLSNRDKIYRQLLLEKFPLVTDSRYAARHRSRMGKTLVTPNIFLPSPNTTLFQNPEALMGFDFNTNLPWEKSTQFFPEFKCSEAREVQCKIPTLAWKKQIKPSQKSQSAKVSFEVFGVDPNQENMEIVPLLNWVLEISAGEIHEESTWTINLPNSVFWVVVIGKIVFEGGNSTQNWEDRTSATYLWAKNFA